MESSQAKARMAASFKDKPLTEREKAFVLALERIVEIKNILGEPNAEKQERLQAHIMRQIAREALAALSKEN